MKFTLAQLVLETHRALPKHPEFSRIARDLTGRGGGGVDAGELPARRIRLTDGFNAAVDKACLLPEAEVATALAAAPLKVPKLWIETTRPGARVRTGCLYSRDDSGTLTMQLVLENTVDEWLAKGLMPPPKGYSTCNRAIYSETASMQFGPKGIEWQSRELNCTLNNQQARDYIAERYRNADLRKQIFAASEIRRLYGAGDFMARAVMLLHCERLVDPAVFEETAAEHAALREEGWRLRQGLRGKASLSATCSDARYDIAAVARVATASGARQVSALVKIVEMQLGESQPWYSRKTGLPMLRADGTPIRTRAHKRNVRVGANYFERQRVVTASRPVDVAMESGGKPVVMIRPK